MTAIQAGFTSVMMDGSLKADGKTPADWDYNVGVTRRVVDMAHLRRHLGRRRARRARLAGNRHGREGRRPRRRGQAQPRPAADQPGRGREVRQARPRSTRWRSPWAPATAPTSSRASRTATVLAMNVIEEIHRKLPNTHLVMHGSSSVPQDLQDIINKYGGKMPPDLGRAGRGDPARHQARRAQDQHRHRQPHGDDRRDPQGAVGEPGRVRSAQVSEARHGSDDRSSASSASRSSAPPARRRRSSACCRSPRWPSATPRASSTRPSTRRPDRTDP